MRQFLPLLLLITLAGCAPSPAAFAPLNAGQLAAQAARPTLDLNAALTRYTKQEKRKVTVADVPDNDGRGGARLQVALPAKDKALLVQLYRLTPRPIDAAELPAGVIDRAADHCAVLYHFELPKGEAIDMATMKSRIRPRAYYDGEGAVMAYEAYTRGETWMLQAKYDLKGKLMQVDMDTFK